eukprot:gene20767-biopygen6930
MLNDGIHHQNFAPELGHRLSGMVSHIRHPIVLGGGASHWVLAFVVPPLRAIGVLRRNLSTIVHKVGMMDGMVSGGVDDVASVVNLVMYGNSPEIDQHE